MALRYEWIVPAIILQVLTIVPVGCTQDSPETKKEQHRQRAVEYYDKGLFQESLIELRNLVKLDPKDADGHYRQGLVYLKLGEMTNLQQAFREFSTAVELNPSIHDAQIKLGQLYLLSNDPANATKHADLVLAAEPDHKEAHILRGLGLIRQQKVRDGIVELKKAIELDPNNPGIYVDLARAYVHLKEMDAAESILQEALRKNPRSLESRFALGDLHLTQGHTDRAETEYRQALKDAPDRAEARNKLGGFYLSFKRPADAEAIYTDWVQTKPQDDNPLIALGDFYRLTQDVEKAHNAYDKALSLNPRSIVARDRAIALYVDTNRLEEAEKRTREILEGNDKDVSGRLFAGRIKLARGKHEEALGILQPLSVDQPGNPVVRHFLGLAYASKGDLPLAVQELKEALKSAPNAIESKTALATVYLNQGAADLAIEQAQGALRINLGNLQAVKVLGDAYALKGDKNKSREVFTALTKAAPNHFIAHYRLGLLSRSDKKDGEALAHFEEALKASPGFIDALAQITSIKVGQGKREEARERLLKQRDLSPKNPLLHVLLGQFYGAARQFDEAEQSFKQAIELDDKVYEAYAGLASIYLQSKKLDLAVKEYKTVLSKNPKLLPAHMVLGMIYESQKKYEEAQSSYQEALKINPRFAPAANNLAWLMMERGGNSDVALSYAQTAREVMPNDPNIADTLGWIYYQKKIYLQAAALLKEAAEKMSENPTVQYHYGMAQYKNGNKAEAVQALEKSLKLKADHPGAAEAKAALSALSSSS